MKYDKEQHNKKASENENFAVTLSDSTAGIEWAIVAYFYAALHYVAAYFSLSGRFHASHGTRLRDISKDPVLVTIYDEYQELYNLSRDARYECMNLRHTHLAFAKKKLAAIKKVVSPHLL